VIEFVDQVALRPAEHARQHQPFTVRVTVSWFRRSLLAAAGGSPSASQESMPGRTSMALTCAESDSELRAELNALRRVLQEAARLLADAAGSGELVPLEGADAPRLPGSGGAVEAES
jgi:hypothetical protein